MKYDPVDVFKIVLVLLALPIMILGVIVLFGRGCNRETPTNGIPIPFEITKIELKRSCLIFISTSIDTLTEGEEVWCSITGKDGPYYLNKIDSATHRLFSAWALKTYNIWAVFRGDTIPYVRNGDSIKGFGCD